MASTTENEQLKPLRAAGHLERFFIARNNLEFYNHVAVAAQYIVPDTTLSATDLELTIYTALREVLSKHPVLNVTLSDESMKEPKWMRLERIDLRETVRFIEHDASSGFDAWIQPEHRLPSFYDAAEKKHPLWRIVVAHSNPASNPETPRTQFGLAFFAHHAIADGISCGAFHLSFLEALNTLLSKPPSTPSSDRENIALIQPSQTLTLLPTLESSTPLPLSPLFTLKKIISAFLYSPSDPTSWTGPPISPTTPSDTNTRSYHLSAPRLTSLLTICRSQNTSLTSLLTVLTARYLAQTYPTFAKFTGSIPFSLRKFTPHSPRVIGNFVSNVAPTFSSSASLKLANGEISCRIPKEKKTGTKADEELWEAARKVSAFVQGGTKSLKDSGVGLLKFVGDVHGFFRGMVGKKRDYAFEVSNIGIVDGAAGEVLALGKDQVDAQGEQGVGVGDVMKGRGKAYFEKVQFSAGHSTTAYPYGICVVSAKGGELCVNLNWQTGVLRDEEALGLLRYLQERLEELA